MSVVHPLRALYTAETGEAVAPGGLVCWFCGGPCAGGADVHAVVRSTFSDMARARAGDDGPVCAACEFYLDFKIKRPGGSRAMGLYTKTVRVDLGSPPTWSEWLREEMYPDLLRMAEHGAEQPVYLTCNYSKQKHVLPWARLTPAGERWPWISTDQGDVRLTPDWLGLTWCIAWLWARGYPKTLLRNGQLGVYQLANSDDPATDLAAAAALAQRGADPLLDFLSYIVTEDNRDLICDSLAGRARPLLRGVEPRAADRRAARDADQRRGKPGAQEPLPPAVVGHARDQGPDRGADHELTGGMEQLGLFAP